MTIYVDDAFISALVGRWNSRWCHMTSDVSKEELHQFAQSIGLKRSYFQDDNEEPGKMKLPGGWHYDVTANKRQQAIRAGAQVMGSYEMVEMMVNRA